MVTEGHIGRETTEIMIKYNQQDGDAAQTVKLGDAPGCRAGWNGH